MKQKNFPNGFENWHETHFVIVHHLTETQDYSGSLSNRTREAAGMGGLMELSATLTDQFEQMYKGREWDGDYYDTIEDFITAYNNGTNP
jgi:hypothetical protein